MAAIAILAAFAAIAASSAGAQEASACEGDAYELARRFTGSWQEFAVTEAGEQLGGNLETELTAGGCAIAQAFTGADGAFSFRSLGYVEAASGQWVETYVMSNGGVSSYRWVVDGEAVLVERIAGGDPAQRRRLRVTFLDPDTYRVTEEQAAAGSDEWTAGIVTMTRRVRDAP